MRADRLLNLLTDPNIARSAHVPKGTEHDVRIVRCLSGHVPLPRLALLPPGKLSFNAKACALQEQTRADQHMPTSIRTFDGHNDALLRLLRSTSDDPVGEFLGGGPKGHIDLPKAAAGHFVGGFFALYSPSVAAPTDFKNMTGDSYALDMPPRLTLGEAHPPIFAMIATLMRVIRRSNG